MKSLSNVAQPLNVGGGSLPPLEPLRVEMEIMKNWGGVCEPVVSICCPTFNHVNYIEDTIRGFLAQETNFSFEIIIRDDCSSDETADIIKSYTNKYPNIIYPIFEAENTFSKGVCPLHAILNKAEGEFLAYCEGDDYWVDPFKLQKQVDFLKKNKDYVITYSSVVGFDENGDVENYIEGATRDLESTELQKAPPINSPTVCFRNLITELPYEYRCAGFGDMFIWSLLGKYGKGKYLSDVKASKYRIHDGGVFSKKLPDQKRWMGYRTSLALYLYYSRMNNTYLSNYFHRDWMAYSFRIYGVFFYVKLISKYIIKKILLMLRIY